MNRRIAVRGIIINEHGQLFCVRLKAYGGRPERDYWCLPGGGIDHDESLLDAIKREMTEETGVTPIVGELLYVHQFVFGRPEQLEFLFHIINADDYKNLDLSTASHADEEIAEYGFVDPKTTHVLPKFLRTEDLQQHIKSHAPTKLFSYM